MRKDILVFMALLQSVFVFGQDAPIKTDMPVILPPSPTVAALMKFEEIPVNNYTGVPDISIPLFSTGTHSKDINLDISLKYHPSETVVKQRASDVGLGWSLFAGGTISRTVVGLPDEYFKDGSITNKVGIYHTTNPNHKNSYYQIVNTLPIPAGSYQQTGSTIADPQLRLLMEEFLWETNEKGKFDTEHDLWQYNFMGYSGSFIIKKNVSTSLLEVTCLDDNRLKIVNIYDSISYVPSGFVVYDEKGYEYVFNVIEVSSSTSYSTNSYGIFNHQGLPTIYNSAFHLSEIRDNNNQLLISFNYGNTINKEITIDKSTKTSDMVNPPTYDHESNPNAQVFWEPRLSTSSFQVVTTTKKLNQININGGAIFEFEYIIGREDENLVLAQTNSSYLHSITMKDQNNSIIKKYELNYIYSKVIDSRMFLDSVKMYNSNLSNHLDYNLEYNFPSTNDDLPYAQDFWGYFNIVPCSFLGNYNDYREVNSSTNKLDLLLKMSLPTGGSIVFDYETNQYSYEGDNPIEEFGEEPDNHYVQTGMLSNGTTIDLHYSDDRKQYVTLYPPLTSDEQVTQNRTVNLYNNNVFVQNIACPDNNSGCCLALTLEQGHHYSIKLITLNSPNNNPYTYPLSFLAKYYTTIPSTKKCLYGGGNRIGTIGYFKNSAPKDYYLNNNNSISIDKEINYRYNFFNDPARSSGSLVFAKPLYHYYLNKRACAEINGVNDTEVTSYNVYTDYNINPTINTQGATVGYKNVSIFETGNGRTDYEYTSPIDFPEAVGDYNSDNRITPTFNYDYKRGLLLSEKIFNNNLKPVKETTNVYYYEESEILVGMKVFYKPRIFITANFNGIVNDCPISSKYPTYNDYLELLDHCVEYPFSTQDDPCPNIYHWRYGSLPMNCAADPSGATCCRDSNGNIGPCSSQFPFSNIICYGWCYTGNTLDFINYTFDKKVKGWAKLVSKTTKNYFYPSGSTTGNIVQTNERYDYNPINKKISESTVTNSTGEVLKTLYYYFNDNNSENRISEIEKIETYRDSLLLSTSNIVYSINFDNNTSYLPQYIQKSKGVGQLENRITYKHYDAYGNPLELQKENGTIVSYIWGYNKTKPIAQIENATNAEIEAALGISFGAVTESDLSAINTLRTSLPNAMVTTYTYIPLVGVSTVTDPRGNTTTYGYDEFNRLKEVRDYRGNILSENEYHYRTQN